MAVVTCYADVEVLELLYRYWSNHLFGEVEQWTSAEQEYMNHMRGWRQDMMCRQETRPSCLSYVLN